MDNDKLDDVARVRLHLLEMVAYPNTHFHYADDRDAVAEAAALLALSPAQAEREGSSVARVPAEPVGSTEKSDPAGISVNTELFPDFAEPLKGHLQYLNAALSWYDGSAADRDVKAAWQATIENLRDVRRAYMQVAMELASKIGDAMTTRVASSGVVVSSPSEASAGNLPPDEQAMLSAAPKEHE